MPYLTFLISLFIMMANIMPCRAFTVTWNFNYGLDRQNFDFVTNPPPDIFLDQSNYELRIWSNHFDIIPEIKMGDVAAKFIMRGNFEIKVQYRLNKALDNGTQIQLNLPNCALVRSNEGYDNYHVWIGYWEGGRATDDTSGVLRFVRTGVNLYAYANNDLIYTYNNYGSQDVTFSFVVQANPWGGWTGGSLDASFDNLEITAAELPGLAVSRPPPCLLLLE